MLLSKQFLNHHGFDGEKSRLKQTLVRFFDMIRTPKWMVVTAGAALPRIVSIGDDEREKLYVEGGYGA